MKLPSTSSSDPSEEAEGVVTMLMRTDPFRELERLTRHVLDGVDGSADMPIDAYRKDDWFYVHFDLPGVKAEDIDVTVEHDVLTVRAERKGANEDAEGVELLASERPQGTFTRRLFLDGSLDTDKLEADYDAGVLTIRMPIAEHARPRKIQVAGGEQRRQLAA